MATDVTTKTADAPQRTRRRLEGIDLARALAMLGMLVEHTLQYPTIRPHSVLFAFYGRSAPLFVLLAGVGVSLATREHRPFSRAMVIARAPFLLIIGMAATLFADGIILQSFALFFVVGGCTCRLPRRALAWLSGVFLIAGPLVLTGMRQHNMIRIFGTQNDVGFHAFTQPLHFLNGMVVEYYPLAIWLGFFFLGMWLGRGDVSTAESGTRLFRFAAPAAVLAFTIGWWGARAFGPPPQFFDLSPPLPLSWSQNWTTYGFSESLGWAISSALVAVAVTGACIWLIAAAPRVARACKPLVALGAMSLSFYLLHGVYLGTLWRNVAPHLTHVLTYFLASVAFWLVFAFFAQLWFRVFKRGPVESVLYAGALLLTAPLRHAVRTTDSTPART
jgi:uncharacterized membrane protein YeiB